MTKDDFAKITDRIVNAYREPISEDQFEEWFRHFGSEDYKLVDEAVTRMLDEYKFFPMVATLRSYIEIQRDAVKPRPDYVPAVPTPEQRTNAQRWLRFCMWIEEMCRTGRRTWEHPKGYEDCIKLRDYFEKEYPDWKPFRKTIVENLATV